MIAAVSPRPLVLIADDDTDILQLLRLRLELWGYGVVQAANGVQALELAREHEPTLAILDVMMPGLTASRWLGSCGRGTRGFRSSS